MDKERRERISEAVGLIHQAREILEGEQMQENMEIIEDVLGCLEDVDDLEDIS